MYKDMPSIFFFCGLRVCNSVLSGTLPGLPLLLHVLGSHDCNSQYGFCLSIEYAQFGQTNDMEVPVYVGSVSLRV